jgi:aminoglycoside 6'-N-acetyltransferase I
MSVEIVDLTAGLVDDVAAMLFASFREAGGWPDLTLPLAAQEVRDCISPDHIARVALDERKVVGFVGGKPAYEGHVYELHPLAVETSRQCEGIGAMLVADFERCVRDHGAVTIMLGSDDEGGFTSLSGKDLYPNPLEHLQAMRNLANHPFTFYRKQGYAVVGCVPDANGPGKPDILMAKRVAQPELNPG